MRSGRSSGSVLRASPDVKRSRGSVEQQSICMNNEAAGREGGDRSRRRADAEECRGGQTGLKKKGSSDLRDV